MTLRILFAGTPEFAVPSLQALLDSDYQVVAVYTQPDRPAGRGQKLTASPVKICAEQAGIPVVQPANFKDPATHAALAAWQPDIMVVAAYGLILPPEILAIPRLGCFNIHASLLPRWRGAAPIQRAILANDSETGICIMRMERGLDTGPIYLTHRLVIHYDETAGEVHDRLASTGAVAIQNVLPSIVAGNILAIPQATEGIQYAPRVVKAEAWIDWQQAATQIDRQIRAFNPWPIAQTTLHGKPLRIWRTNEPRFVTSRPAEPGTIIAAKPTGIEVATGSGGLLLTQVQLPGKRVMSAQDFINAHELEGVQLGIE